MVACISMFFPAALSTAVWCHCSQKKRSWAHILSKYLVSVLLINVLSLGAMAAVYENLTAVFESGTFLLKYLVMSVVLAVALSVAGAWHLKKKMTVSHELSDCRRKNQFDCIMLIFYAIILFLIHVVRIGNNNYWGDECYSIKLSRMNIPNMLSETASDVHPPLYYLLLQLVCRVLGDGSFAYRITSLIPFGIFLVLSVTVVRKKFGSECCAILITFAGLLDSSITYNLEARMYSWGLLFVFMSYYMLYKILHERNNWNYVWFAAASLCAAYTHYYCLLIVAFFYLALLIMSAVDCKKYLKPVLITCVATVAGYLPWFLILIQSFQRVSDSFWIDGYPPLRSLLAYLFLTRSPYHYLLLAIFMVTTAVYFYRELNIKLVRSQIGKKRRVRVDLSGLTISTECIWVMAGLCSILGTCVVGILVSILIRPLILLRYLYPAAVIVWLVMGIQISKLKRKKTFSVLLILLVFLLTIPSYYDIVTEENRQLQMLEKTLQATTAQITSEDQILTTNAHIAWTVSAYYYPCVSCKMYDVNSIETSENGMTYWLFIENTEIETTLQELQSREIAYEEVVTDGNLGTNFVNVYKVVS